MAACQNKLGSFEEAVNTYNQAFAMENTDYGALTNHGNSTSLPVTRGASTSSRFNNFN